MKHWMQSPCHHPHRFNELATRSEMWNGNPRLECVNGWHPPSKTTMGVLPLTCRSEGKWLAGKQPSQVLLGCNAPDIAWLFSRTLPTELSPPQVGSLLILFILFIYDATSFEPIRDVRPFEIHLLVLLIRMLPVSFFLMVDHAPLFLSSSAFTFSVE